MLYTVIRNLLFQLPPEVAHNVTLKILSLCARTPFLQLAPPVSSHNADRTIMGIHFPNIVGLAAGLDKNGEYVDGLASLGFGFIEIGTITPRPQPGNPMPRLFRMPKACALINRMGFNNHGVEYLIKHIKRAKFKGILGINIGKNFDTSIENAADDYLICMEKIYTYASYITINISSPNTPGLRQLQYGQDLKNLLQKLKTSQAYLHQLHKKYVPLVVKISPDLSDAEIKDIAAIFIEQNIDGVISCNTTVSRAGVETLPFAKEAGGLSGKPLFEKSLHNIKILSETLKGCLPIIACGGITTVQDVLQMQLAGADLVQIYTGFIYHGPQLIKDLAAAPGSSLTRRGTK